MTNKPTDGPAGEASNRGPAPLGAAGLLDLPAGNDASDRQNLADTLTVPMPHEPRAAPPKPDLPPPTAEPAPRVEEAHAEADPDAPVTGNWFVPSTTPPIDLETPPAGARPRTDPMLLALGGLAVLVVVIAGAWAFLH